MRLNTLRLRGITEAFPNEVCVDFDSLGEGLIAIVGENGAGKSTLIGSIFAALFRQLPGQKRSLYDFATHAQPEIDLTFSVNGTRYRSLLKLDPKSRQMESYIFNGDGKPLTNGKKEPFEELVTQMCWHARVFSCQHIFQPKAHREFSLAGPERAEGFVHPRIARPGPASADCGRMQRERQKKWRGARPGLEGQCKSLKDLAERCH